MRVVGSVYRSPATRMDCAEPLRAVCGECGHNEFWRCDRANEERCPDCAERRRRLITRLVDTGAANHIGNGRRAYFVTLTAPGTNDHRRWFQGKLTSSGEARPSGYNHRPARVACDCHLTWERTSLAEWNAQESAHWNRLRLALKREVAGSLDYIGSVEVQARGALHRHVVVMTDQVIDHARVQALALAAGYGCVLDVEELQSASKAARYLAKYVTKSTTERPRVPWRRDVLNLETGEIESLHTIPTFRTWSSSYGWGVTLKGLRDIARVQARARARYLVELAGLLADDRGSDAEPPAMAGLSPAPG